VWIGIKSDMITRSPEHDTDYAGQLLLRSAIASLGWRLSPIENDYGIDFSVQVFHDRFPSGAWFHIQLKSSDSPAYSADGSFVSHQLSLDHARHYATEMRAPIFLVHADIQKKRILWHCPQLDANLTLALNGSGKTIAIRIPTNQQFPDDAAQLLSDLKAIYSVLASREIVATSSQAFESSLMHFPNQDELRSKYQEKCDVLNLQRISDLCRNKQHEEAKARINSILTGLDSIIEVKFQAHVQLKSIRYSETLMSGVQEDSLFKVFLSHAQDIRELTRHGPNYLKFHSLIVKKAAELGILGFEDSCLYMAQVQHLQIGGDPASALGMYIRRSALSKLISAKYSQCARLARYASVFPDRWFLGRAITEVVNATAVYFITLRSEGQVQYADSLARSALHLCQLAAWIGEETEDFNGIVLAVISSLVIAENQNSDAFRWAQNTATAIKQPLLRKDALDCIDKAISRWEGKHVDGDYVGDNEWQVIRKMANANGIDTTDENAPLVRSLRIAARDNNPERVLIKCEHLLATPGAIGPNARLLAAKVNIQTASSKVIHCILHNYHEEGKELDSAYQAFRAKYCDSCPDSSPRPPDWKFRGVARRALEAQSIDFVRRLAGTRFGRRMTPED
jgi:hypothetical protein